MGLKINSDFLPYRQKFVFATIATSCPLMLLLDSHHAFSWYRLVLKVGCLLNVLKAGVALFLSHLPPHHNSYQIRTHFVIDFGDAENFILGGSWQLK
jgi:hypothetical protein